MKKLIEGIPFILLLSLCPYFFFREPNISQSIILLGISALCGFRYFLIDKSKPDYLSIFDARLKEMEANYQSKIDQYSKDVKEVKDLYGMATVESSRKKAADGFLW